MNSKKLNNGLAVSFAVSLSTLLLLAGCKDKNNATADANSTPAMSSGDTNGGMVNADNSGKNVRDRNDMTLTPGDQGTTDADRQMTQKVRQTLVSGTNDYSMTAKNVKIIAVNGKVTLRGPVNTDSEKSGIDAIAESVAGAGNVDNQLEVKANP